MSTPHPRSRAHNTPNSYLERKPIGRGDQRLEDAGLRECVAGYRNDRKFGTGPGLMQFIGRNGRGRHVVTTLDDDTRNVGQPVGIGDQLTLRKPAPMEEVVVLDACESQRVRRIAELRNQAFVRLQGDGGSLPGAPGHTGRPVNGLIGIEEQLVIGGDGVTNKGATAQRSEERFIAFRKELPGRTVVVEVELAATEGENSSQHKLCDTVSVLFGVCQGQRAAPGSAEDLPPLDAAMLTQPLDVGNQVPRGVGTEIGARLAGMRPALATTALIKKDDAVSGRVEQPTDFWIQRSAGPTVQEDRRLACRITALLPIDLLAVADVQHSA